jgi:hypothetical protein
VLSPGAAMAICGGVVLVSAVLLRRVATEHLPLPDEVATVGA